MFGTPASSFYSAAGQQPSVPQTQMAFASGDPDFPRKPGETDEEYRRRLEEFRRGPEQTFAAPTPERPPVEEEQVAEPESDEFDPAIYGEKAEPDMYTAPAEGDFGGVSWRGTGGPLGEKRIEEAEARIKSSTRQGTGPRLKSRKLTTSERSSRARMRFPG